MSSNKFNKIMAYGLAESIKNNTNIKSIKLSNCSLDKLDDNSLNKLFIALINNTSINNIDLSSGVEFSNTMAIGLADVIQNNHNIKSIDLRGYNLPGVIFTALRNNNSITNINFSSNNFNNTAITDLAYFIQNNRNIKSIDLSLCSLDELNEESLNKLFSAIKNSFSITNINLMSNSINNKFALIIADVIQNNHSIKFINLETCSLGNINENSLNALFKAFEKNTSIINVNLEGNYLDRNLDSIITRNREIYMIYMNNYRSIAEVIRNYNPTFIPNEVKLNNVPREIHEHILDYTLGKEHNKEHLDKIVKKSFRTKTVEEKKEKSKKDCSLTSYCTIV